MLYDFAFLRSSSNKSVSQVLRDDGFKNKWSLREYKGRQRYEGLFLSSVNQKVYKS